MKHTFKLITITLSVIALWGCQISTSSPHSWFPSNPQTGCTWEKDVTVYLENHYLEVPGGNENILTNSEYFCLLPFLAGGIADIRQMLAAPNNHSWASTILTWTVNEVNNRCTVSTNQDEISLDNTNYSCMLNNEINVISKSAPRLTDFNPANCEHHYELNLTLNSGTILIWEKEWFTIDFPNVYYDHSQTEFFYVSSYDHPLRAKVINPNSVTRRVYLQNQFKQI